MSTGDFPPSGIRVDGFNEGWIDFEFGAAKSRKGTTRLESVLKYLVGRGEVGKNRRDAARLDLADLQPALDTWILEKKLLQDLVAQRCPGRKRGFPNRRLGDHPTA